MFRGPSVDNVSSPSFTGLDFSGNFFSLSSGLQNELFDPKICKLLKELEQSGYIIDEKKIVFGPQNGVYWPSLINPKGASINFGIVTGFRGSVGIGSTSLLQYLKNKKDELEVEMLAETIKQVAVPRIQKTEPLDAKPKERTYKPKKSSLDTPTGVTSFKDMPFGSAVVVSSSKSLSFLQDFGVFLDLPPEPVNALEINKFLGGELFIYNHGRCLVISKNNKILVCSAGIAILPTEESYRGTMYIDSWGTLTDLPTQEQPLYRSKFDDMDKLEAILPYLNGIPEYVD